MTLAITTLATNDTGVTSRNTINTNFANILASYPASAVLAGLTDTQTFTNKTLTSPVITSPTINVGSDATGDVYYRNAGGVFTRLGIGTNNQVLTSNGTTPGWSTPTTIQNASTSIAGIVQEATLAQLLAGTQTGGTGADLFVNPSIFNAGVQAVPYRTMSMVAGDSLVAGNAVYAGAYQSLPVSFDSKNTGLSNGSSITTLAGSVSITVGNNSNRLLVVFIDGYSSAAVPGISAVNFGGNAMTQQSTQTLASDGKTGVYTIVPSVGTANVTFNITSGTSGNIAYTVHVFSLYNCTLDTVTTGTTTIPSSSTSLETSLQMGFIIGDGGTGGGFSGSYTSTTFGNNFASVGGVQHVSAVGMSNVINYIGANQLTNGTSGSVPGLANTYVVNIKPTQTPTYNAVNLTSTLNSITPTKFLGFSTGTFAAGATATIALGTINFLSGLTPNTQYYLNDSAGSIGTSAGTNSKKVGIAVSSTTLVMKDSI